MTDIKKYLHQDLGKGLYKLYDAAEGTDYQNDFLMVVGRYNSLQSQRNQGTVSLDFATMSENQIRAAAIYHLERMERDYPKIISQINTSLTVNVIQIGGSGQQVDEEPMDITDTQLLAVEEAIEIYPGLQDKLEGLLAEKLKLERQFRREEQNNISGASEDTIEARKDVVRRILELKETAELSVNQGLKSDFKAAHDLFDNLEDVTLQDLFNWSDKMAVHVDEDLIEKFDLYMIRLQRQEKTGNINNDLVRKAAVEAKKISQHMYRNLD